MAKQKKSQAERAESARSKNKTNKPSGKKTQKELTQSNSRELPVRVISSISFLAAFLFLVVISCFQAQYQGILD